MPSPRAAKAAFVLFLPANELAMLPVVWDHTARKASNRKKGNGLEKLI